MQTLKTIPIDQVLSEGLYIYKRDGSQLWGQLCTQPLTTSTLTMLGHALWLQKVEGVVLTGIQRKRPEILLKIL